MVKTMVEVFLVKLVMDLFHFTKRCSIDDLANSQSSKDYYKQLFFQFSVFQHILECL